MGPAAPGGVRAVSAQQRRDELVRAGVPYLLEHGVADLTLRPFAAALGTSDRMLLYYFVDKDRLVDALLEAANEVLLAQLRDGRIDAPTPGGVVWSCWQMLADPAVADHVRLWQEVYLLGLREPGRYVEVLRRTSRPWEALVAGALSRAGVTRARAERLATIVLDATESLLLDARVTGEVDRVVAAVGELGRMVDAAGGSGQT